MLDEIAIASVAGVLLWSWVNPGLGSKPSIQLAINQLFQDVLLREGDTTKASYYDCGPTRVKWRRNKERGVVIVATYNRELARTHDFSYVDKLLAATSKVVQEHVSEAMGALTESLDFDKQWAAVQRTVAARTGGAAFAIGQHLGGKGADGAESGPDGGTDHLMAMDASALLRAATSSNPVEGPGDESPSASASESKEASPKADKALSPTASREERMAALKRRRQEKRKGQQPSRFQGVKTTSRPSGSPSTSTSTSTSTAGGGGGGGGKKRTAGGLTRLSAKEAAALSYNKDEVAGAEAGVERVDVWETDTEIKVEWEDDDDGEADGDGDGSASSGSSSWFAGTAFGRALGVFSGGHTLTEEDLTEVSGELKDVLKSKNVTSRIADDLVDSVKASLIGTKAGSFESMLAVVRGALRDRISTILTPHRRIDPISDARANRDRHTSSSSSSSSSFRPYVVVFTGVNGVGKSTSLAKVVYHFKASGLKPLVAACDTFRSGAVEQLKRHTTALGVPLFEKGYEKDPAKVAASAIQAATERGCDVVCVDTAGRMQGKKTLMEELAQLVSLNQPDLVLFVGEALAGNDGLDQLVQFNKSLRSYAPAGSSPHGIDGIFLTKCDTIDDKIGAAVSMVHGTEIPIVFMGVGQTHRDMKRLNVDAVVKALIS